MIVKLPWPPKILSPNAREHYHAVARIKAQYREACWALAHQAGIKAPADAEPHITLTFVPPDKRRRDLDNMLASMKSGLDGLADAMGCDDSRWTLKLKVDRTRVLGLIIVEVQI